MKKIKVIVPLLIVLFVMLGGLAMINTAEANPGKYCNFIPKVADCWPGGIKNCICIDVTVENQ